MQTFTFLSMFALCIGVAVSASFPWIPADPNAKPCAAVIEDKLHFGMRFRTEIEKLFNLGFKEDQCNVFVAYLAQELSQWTDNWDKLNATSRRQIVDQLMPRLHQRARKAFDEKRHLFLYKEEAVIDFVLQFKQFANGSTLFETVEDHMGTLEYPSCVERVQRTLMVAESFVPELAQQLNNLSYSDCDVFLDKVKVTFDKFVRMDKFDWKYLPIDKQLRLAGNVLAMVHINELKNGLQSDSYYDYSDDSTKNQKSEPAGWKTLIKNDLFLGNVFATGNATIVPK